MLNRLLELSLRQRTAVLLATVVLVAVGLWSALRLPIDAVPDITSPQVQINTAVPALAPEEIEKLVTFRIENAMAGLPNMVELRSLSKFGLSQVVVTVDGSPSIVSYQGLAPMYAGLYQVNFQIPAGLAPGTHRLAIQTPESFTSMANIEVGP